MRGGGAVEPPEALARPGQDTNDAVHLAGLLRLDEVTPIAILSIDQEAARSARRGAARSRRPAGLRDLVTPGTSAAHVPSWDLTLAGHG